MSEDKEKAVKALKDRFTISENGAANMTPVALLEIDPEMDAAVDKVINAEAVKEVKVSFKELQDRIQQLESYIREYGKCMSPKKFVVEKYYNFHKPEDVEFNHLPCGHCIYCQLKGGKDT